VKLLRNILLLSLVFILSFCDSSNTSIIESYTPPVILIVKNDSVVMVEDAKGGNYIVNTPDRVNYRVAFLEVGDTLKLNTIR
jgi:hypothetical protein